MSKWGLYDQADCCWIGGPKGPFSFTEAHVARLAARLTGQRMRREITAMPLGECLIIPKDTITPEISLTEAVERLGL